MFTKNFGHSAFVLFLSVLTMTPAGSQEKAPAPAAREDASLVIEFPVEKFQLSNGLTVLLSPDRTVPLVSVHTWFRVGSRNEQPGFTGMAHLFEHMMFKGAKRYSNKEFDRILQSNGGTNNAFTTQDYTAYHITLPSSKLELALDMESDRMESLQVTVENLISEREVVKEERRLRVENEVTGTMNELQFASLFKVHPYRWPVIGYMSDLDNVTVEKCREFFSTYYSPSNAVLSIAGDFNPAEARKLIEKLYARIPNKRIKPSTLPKEPVQVAIRRARIKRDIQNEYLDLSYLVPAAGLADTYPLDLVASILTDGISSRLSKKLVYDMQIATGVHASNMGLSDSGVFEVMAVLKPGVSAEKALKAIQGVIFELSSKPVSEQELDRAKNQVIKSYVDSLKTVNGRAQAIAMNEVALGDYRRLFTDIELYQKVTTEQIRDVVKAHLRPSSQNIIIAIPKSSKDVSAGANDEKEVRL